MNNCFKGLIFLCVLQTFVAKAQDPNFSQFYANRIYVNPAFAGADPGLRVSLNYRRFWASVPGKFETFSASADIADFNIAGGLGLIALSSVEGEGKLRTTNIAAMYSYRLTLIPRMFDIHLGLQAGLFQRSLDFSNLVFSDQLDATYGNLYQTQAQVPNGKVTRNMLDIGTGILARFNIKTGKSRKKLLSNTAGLSLKHINMPNESLTGKNASLPIKLSVLYSCMFNVSPQNSDSKIYLSPNFLYEKQAQFSTFNFGMFMLRAPMMVGLWYRNQNILISPSRTDALIANLGFRGENGDKTIIFQIGYSYDLTLSGMLGASGGSHEISTSIEFTTLKLSRLRSSIAMKRARSIYNFNGPRNLPKIF